MFGGLKGLEYSLDVDDKLQVDEPSLLFDQYLNTCPNQGSATIRTEVMLINIHDIIRNDSKTSVIHTYIQGRSQTLYTAPCNGVVRFILSKRKYRDHLYLLSSIYMFTK